MKIKNGKKAFIVRYSDFLKENCIDIHKDVLAQNGYCWFGKLGQKPSNRYASLVLAEEEPVIILRSKKEDYICRLTEISTETPSDAIPAYYKDVLFANGNYPSSYFKLTSIQPFDRKNYKYFRVNSSRNEVTVALQKSMNSMFFVECIQDFETEETK